MRRRSFFATVLAFLAAPFLPRQAYASGVETFTSGDLALSLDDFARIVDKHLPAAQQALATAIEEGVNLVSDGDTWHPLDERSRVIVAAAQERFNVAVDAETGIRIRFAKELDIETMRPFAKLPAPIESMRTIRDAAGEEVLMVASGGIDYIVDKDGKVSEP